MAAVNASEIINAIQLGFAGVLVWAVLTGRLIPGGVYRDLLRDRDDWRTIALTGVRAAATGTRAAAKALVRSRTRRGDDV